MTELLKNFINIVIILNSTNTRCRHTGTSGVRTVHKSPSKRQKRKEEKIQSLNEKYSWDAKPNRYNPKKKKRIEKKKNHCAILTYQWDNTEIGLIDSSVNIAEEQRRVLKPNCTEGERLGRVVSCLHHRCDEQKPLTARVKTKCKPEQLKKKSPSILQLQVANTSISIPSQSGILNWYF